MPEREREIQALVDQGASNRQVAERLYVTEGTVKNHMSSILSKLGVRDRTQAVLKAKELGLARLERYREGFMPSNRPSRYVGTTCDCCCGLSIPNQHMTS